MPTTGPAPKLLRLSEVARIFQVHPKTAYYWVRTGRLTAIQSPGGLLRVRAEDVRPLVDAAGLALPADIAESTRTVVVLEHRRGAARPVLRALRGKGVGCDVHDDWHTALIAVGHRAPSAVLLVGCPEHVDLGGLVAAIGKNADRRPVIAAIAAGEAGTEAQEAAGIEHVFEAGDAAGLIAALTAAR